MGDWLVSLEGTEAGRQAAVILALCAAFFHAALGAAQKGRFDPWTLRAAIDVGYAALALPFLLIVPFPEPHMWAIFATAWVIHSAYKVCMANAYERAAYTVVYPVARGMGPLVTMLFAGVVFAESYSALQWGGVALLMAGIFGLAAYNLATITVERAALPVALLFAVLTGIAVAAYTTYDAYGIRATADPFTFLAWFFVIDGVTMPVLATLRARRRGLRIPLRPLVWRGLFGGGVAILSFGAILLATRLDKVGEAAVLRETSVIFAAIIGTLVLKETVGPRRILLMTLIAAGAVLVELGR